MLVLSEVLPQHLGKDVLRSRLPFVNRVGVYRPFEDYIPVQEAPSLLTGRHILNLIDFAISFAEKVALVLIVNGVKRFDIGYFRLDLNANPNLRERRHPLQVEH